MSARDDLYTYTTVAFKETKVPPVIHEHVTKLLNAYQAEVLGQALGELAAIKKELALIESLICQCEPQREHDDYRRPADYLHAADCLVAAAQQAATDDTTDDNRRRLYIDGKGNGWISVCHDEGTEWVVPVQPEGAVEQDIGDIADETGSMREIGRCW